MVSRTNSTRTGGLFLQRLLQHSKPPTGAACAVKGLAPESKSFDIALPAASLTSWGGQRAAMSTPDLLAWHCVPQSVRRADVWRNPFTMVIRNPLDGVSADAINAAGTVPRRRPR